MVKAVRKKSNSGNQTNSDSQAVHPSWLPRSTWRWPQSPMKGSTATEAALLLHRAPPRQQKLHVPSPATITVTITVTVTATAPGMVCHDHCHCLTATGTGCTSLTLSHWHCLAVSLVALLHCLAAHCCTARLVVRERDRLTATVSQCDSDIVR